MAVEYKVRYVSDLPSDNVCNLAWQPRLGSARLYCDYAAQHRITIDGDPYACCHGCLAELIELGHLTDVKAA